ncbi:MAG: cytochrome C biogenesis protein [Luminiphilus sp.]|nr:cytochrome C biogenesis protein [Luminiphilus sp.]MBL6820713.1 cytochrome C biogenesis protein [Luminiphilus sp.]
MSEPFLLLALSLMASAVAWVVVLPRYWVRRGEAETNADWLRLRQRELEDESPSLQEEAALRLIDDGADETGVMAYEGRAYNLKAQVLGGLLLVALVVGLYQQLGGWEDVEIADALANLETAQPDDVMALIDRIEVRSEARPDNADYSLLLAEYFLSGNQPNQATRYFDRLVEAGATSPEILGKAAQAEFLSSGRILSGQARARAEQALAMDPMQSTALATLGMAAFEEADYAQAIEFWQRLRTLEAPGSPGYEMLGQVIERARQELAQSGQAPPVSSPESSDDVAEASDPGPGVAIEILQPAGEDIPEGAVIFVLARPEGAESGMPIAVVRRQVSAWPLSVRLDDSTSMAGQLLSGFSSVSIEVQISINGQPGRTNALLWAHEQTVRVGQSEPLKLRPSRD